MDGKTRIADLKPGMSATIEGEVKAISEPREVRTKFGREMRVADAIIDDGTGSISLTLWDRDIDRVAIGDIVEVQEGWVNEFRGSLRISAGRSGRIVVKGAGASEE